MNCLYMLLVIIILAFPQPGIAKEKSRNARAQEAAGPPEPEKTQPRQQKRGDDKKDSKNAGSARTDKSDKADSGALHRVEFVITGTECPVCIDRMSEKMKKVPGVKKAAIFRFSVTNYGAVIYNAKLAQWQDIVKSVDDENVGFDGVKDVVLSKEEARRLIDPEGSAK